MLFLKDLDTFLSQQNGLKLADVPILTISITCSENMYKGLYIPIHEEINILQAIHEGAIGAVISSKDKVPSHVPTHFPLFVTEDLIQTIQELLQNYYQKMKQEEWETMTNFIFYSEDILIKQYTSYDIAVDEQYVKILRIINQERKGGEKR